MWGRRLKQGTGYESVLGAKQGMRGGEEGEGGMTLRRSDARWCEARWTGEHMKFHHNIFLTVFNL